MSIKEVVEILSSVVENDGVYALALEEAIRKMYPDNEFMYRNKVLQLLYNLRINPKLKKETSPDLLVQYDDELLRCESKNDTTAIVDLNTILKDAEKYKSTTSHSNEDHVFLVCRQCKSKEITFVQKQISGGDEAMTYFCSCKKCFAQWKIR